jgi:hypothetical protein
MYDTYERTPSLKSKPKTQRAIIADILLEADEPISFDKIVARAKDADYEGTFKRGTQIVTIEESVTINLDLMIKGGTVKKGMSKA